MSNLWRLAKTTLIGGILFLIPLVFIVVVLGKAFQIMKVVGTPLAKLIPVDNVFGYAVVEIMTVAVMVVTCLLVGTSVAGCSSAILNAGFTLQASAAMLHALGGAAGYFLTKPFYSEKISRTFAIEFAMKSSAFGFLLASLHFPEFAVRVPSAHGHAFSVFRIDKSELSPIRKPSTAARSELRAGGPIANA